MIKRLDEIIDNGFSLAVLDDSKDPENIGTVHEIIEEQVLVGWRDAFDWLATFLENRRDYHKKRQVKTKVEMQLLEDALTRSGVDVAKIKKEAERAADDSIL
jgi:hypothetical protein